jgi:hypothetical protein
VYLTASGAEAEPTAAKERVIGVAVSNGFRAQLTAVRVPAAGSAPDQATVRIAAFKKSSGK